MTDDIVTRLREQHASFRVAVGVSQNIVLHSLYTEAADEIERLRAMLAHGLTQGSTCEGCSICEELKAFHKKVMRGE